MAKKSVSTQNSVNKKIASYLKSNPEVVKTLKVFNINLNEYTDAIKSISSEQPIINLKSTEWLPGNR